MIILGIICIGLLIGLIYLFRVNSKTSYELGMQKTLQTRTMNDFIQLNNAHINTSKERERLAAAVKTMQDELLTLRQQQPTGEAMAGNVRYEFNKNEDFPIIKIASPTESDTWTIGLFTDAVQGVIDRIQEVRAGQGEYLEILRASPTYAEYTARLEDHKRKKDRKKHFNP